MNNEGLNRASIVVEGPARAKEAPQRVNVDVLFKPSLFIKRLKHDDVQ